MFDSYHSRMHATGERNHLALAIIALVMAMMGPAVAAEVYRWTDADGQVHYGKHAPHDAAGARSVQLPESVEAVHAADPDDAQRRERQRRLLEAYTHERRQKQAAAAESAQRQQEQAQRCRALQAQWRRLTFGGRVYFKREDGTREYLSDERRAAEQAKLRPAYIKACGEAPS